MTFFNCAFYGPAYKMFGKLGIDDLTATIGMMFRIARRHA